MSSKKTSVYLSRLEREKIRRFFGVGPSAFIRLALQLIDENQYIKNKMTEKAKEEK